MFKNGVIVLSKSKFDLLNDIGKRRGLYWSSYEIYGGVAGLYDFGPIGLEIKRRIMMQWLKYFVYQQGELVVEIETPIITPRIVLVASGHEEHFTDPITECTKCGRVFRADHLIEEQTGLKAEGLSMDELWNIIRKHNVKCPVCGGELSKPKPALLLFKTEIGPYKGSPGYLRPETAQGMFVSFKNVLNVARNKLPLGIAQIGKVGRNEISPRQGLLRLREFTIMEIEFFFDPLKAEEEAKQFLTSNILEYQVNVLTAKDKMKNIDEARSYTVKELLDKRIVLTPWMAYWMAIGNMFLESLGIPPEKIRFDEKLPNEKAHYSEQTFDQEVYTEKYGWVEVAGYSYRTTYDLGRHIKYSGADLTVFRRYERPKTIRKKIVYPNPSKIREMTGNKIRVVMKKLSQLDKEEILEELESKGYVEIEGYKLGKEAFYIKEVEEKIHGEKYIPHVVEPSFGLERIFYVVLENALTTDNERIYLKLKPQLAPYDVAVYPLVSGAKAEHRRITMIARGIAKALRTAGFNVYYDEEGSIGRRYMRGDEIGIPYAITVDYDTLKDYTVTIRDRDTRKQERIHINELLDELNKLLNRSIEWTKILKEHVNITP